MEHAVSAYTVKQGYTGLNTRGIEKTVQKERGRTVWYGLKSSEQRGFERDYLGPMGCGLDYMFIYLQNPYIEILIPNVKAFGNGAFGRWICALLRRGNEGACFSLSAIREATARRHLSASQEESSHHELNWLDLGLHASRTNKESISVV